MKKFFILFIAVALICAFSMPAAAMEEKTPEERIDALEGMVGGWTFYGSARMATWYTDSSEDWAAQGWAGGDADESELTWNLQGNSRIGARVQRGNLGGRFEYGSGPNLRLLYGTWNFGGGELLVGQAYTPINIFGSNQVFAGDNDLLDTGFPYNGRHPMIQVSTGGFNLALITPEKTGSGIDNGFPKVEASYGFSTDMFSVTPYAGYQTYDETTTDETTGVSATAEQESLVAGLAFDVKAGPATISGNVYHTENGGAYGLPSQVNNSGNDEDTLGVGLVANFAASDTFKPEIGVGYIENSDADQEAWNYYANATIHLAKSFFIVPEVGFLDLDTNGDQLYVGAKWQINW